MNNDKDNLSSPLTQDNEIILYKPDETLAIDVRLGNDTIWLTQQQIAQLFGVKQPAISKHLKNIYNTGELEESSTYSILEYVGNDGNQVYKTKYYNLDAILSVGYRVNSVNATRFRQWANKVLKEYLLRGYSINQRLLNMEDSINRRFQLQGEEISKLRQDVDFLVKTNLPPKEDILFDGQFFDAYEFVEKLVRMARKRIVLVDNYVDAKILRLLDCRAQGVKVTVYSQLKARIADAFEAHNQQYEPIELLENKKVHDRFMIIDEDVYHIGHSLKDLGKKISAFSKLSVITGSELIAKL